MNDWTNEEWGKKQNREWGSSHLNEVKYEIKQKTKKKKI